MNPAPLDGLRVVEFAAEGPLAHCGLMLAALGALVDRIDRPGTANPEMSAPEENVLNRGRRSVVLDLKEPDQAELAGRLVGRADVLLEGFRPGVMERLGLGPERALADNPRLVYARITGWSRRTERGGRAGHDINFLARSGVLDAIGTSDSGPVPPLMLAGDFAGGGLNLAVAVLAALHERERSGLGQVIDTSIHEGVMSLGSFLFGAVGSGRWSPDRGTNAWDTGAHWYNVYRTADGRWLSVGAVEPSAYQAFMHGLGLSAVPRSQWQRERWPLWKGVIGALIGAEELAHWVEVFESVDACVEPVLSVTEALACAQAAGDDLVQQTTMGPLPRVVPEFSRSGAVDLVAAPIRDADRAAILSELGPRRPVGTGVTS